MAALLQPFQKKLELIPSEKRRLGVDGEESYSGRCYSVSIKQDT